MKKPAILLPIETTARELLYKLILSMKFAQKNYPVYLGTKEEIYALFPQLQSFVYFDKGYHKGNSEKIYAAVKKQNGIIINLDEEGGVDYEDMSTIAQRYSEKLFQSVDMVFFWGKRQYAFLKEIRKNFNSITSVVSGHPRFEILKPEFHGLYKSDVDKITERHGNFILFNTNMGFGNNIRGDEFVRMNYGSRIQNIDDVIEYDKMKVAAYISLIKRLSSLQEKKIILRPHPEENSATYKLAFFEHTNVDVLFEGSVIPWILASDIMIHPDCTTGVEAAFMEKQPVSYLPETNKKVITEMPLAVSRCFIDESDCVSYILGEKYENGGVYSQLLSDVFSREKDSLEVVVGETDELIKTSMSNNVVVVNKPGMSHIIGRRMKKLILKILKRGNQSDLLIKNKRKGLDDATVQNLVRNIYNVSNFKKRIMVKMILENLIYIRR